jgi:DNA-binding response OmpR family regulator
LLGTKTVLPRKLLLFECFEENICDSLAGFFQKAGFQTQLVSSVGACMGAVRTSPPDVVLMITNNIREECAFALAEAIRAVQPKCGFVFFLAGDEEDGRESFLAAGYKFNIRAIPTSARALIVAALEALDSPVETFVTPPGRRASSDG